MKAVLSILLAFLQYLGFTVGLIPYSTDVDYGGIEHVETVVSEYMPLITNGESDYKIVISHRASETENTAAKELQSYLEKISGCKLPIIYDNLMGMFSHEIIVGRTLREGKSTYTVDANALGEEGFMLKVFGEKLVIAGGGDRGTLYGVYSFLEEQLGCRWFTPKLEKVPETPDVKINAKLDDVQKPAFSIRRDYTIGATHVYAAKQKVNAHIRTNNTEYGGSTTFVLWDVTLNVLVPDALFEEHPDYFAYREESDSRTTAHVCLTSEGAFETAVENARQEIRECTNGANHLHIGQKDNQDYCECDNCKKLYEQYGSVSAPTIIFTNRLARELADEFPDMTYTFYAYNETRNAPVGKELYCDDNVIPVICGSHQACHSHPYYECGHEDESENNNFAYIFSDHELNFADSLKEWVEISPKTYIYEYTINFLNTQQFFSNLATLQPNAQWMYETGVTGYIYHCGDGHKAAFNELRNYLICKIMWNPYIDVEYHMLDFMKAFYGEDAAQYIKQYIDMQTAKNEAVDHAFDFSWHYQTAFFNPVEVCKMDKMWENALACDVTEQQRFEIEKSELSWRFYKANLFLEEYFFLNPLRMKENEQLYDDFIAHDITSISSVGGAFPAKENINFVQRPFNWRGN